MTVQAVPDKWAQDRAGSWGNFGIAYREVSLPTTLGQWDVAKVMELAPGMTIHAVQHAVQDAGAGSSTVDIGYGTDEEFRAYDGAANATARSAAWADAKRQYFGSAIATSALAFADSRTDTYHQPLNIDQIETAYDKSTGSPAHETPQYLALACTTDPSNATTIRVWVLFEFEGN